MHGCPQIPVFGQQTLVGREAALTAAAGKLEIIVGYCLAHSRRRFVNVVASFPEQCRYVLEVLGRARTTADRRSGTPGRYLCRRDCYLARWSL